MGQNRWVQPVTDAPASSLTNSVPPLPSIEVVYRTDPDALAAVLPPPLQPPAEPRVHVRITDIDLTFGEYRHKELVAYFAVDAVPRVKMAEPESSNALRRGWTPSP